MQDDDNNARPLRLHIFLFDPSRENRESLKTISIYIYICLVLCRGVYVLDQILCLEKTKLIEEMDQERKKDVQC